MQLQLLSRSTLNHEVLLPWSSHTESSHRTASSKKNSLTGHQGTMNERNHIVRSLASSPMELPRRPRPQMALRQSNGSTGEQDSPHIHINPSDITYKTGSQSDMSICSRADSPMDEVTRHYLSPPDLRYNSCFEDFRIPPFSTMATLPDVLNDSDLRDASSNGTASRLAQRNPRHRRNMHSLGGPGDDDSQGLLAASQMKSPHHRSRNRALSSAQFDDILTEVFYR